MWASLFSKTGLNSRVNTPKTFFEKQGLQENLRHISVMFPGAIWATGPVACPEKLKIAYGST